MNILSYLPYLYTFPFFVFHVSLLFFLYFSFHLYPTKIISRFLQPTNTQLISQQYILEQYLFI
jgi:hypothetical protein